MWDWMDGVEWMDTPQTVTTTRAPAVLKNVLLMNLMGAVSTNVYYSDETDICICISLKRE